MKNFEKRYQGISLPKELLNKIDVAIGNKVYLSKAEFIRQAIRNELDRLERNLP